MTSSNYPPNDVFRENGSSQQHRHAPDSVRQFCGQRRSAGTTMLVRSRRSAVPIRHHRRHHGILTIADSRLPAILIQTVILSSSIHRHTRHKPREPALRIYWNTARDCSCFQVRVGKASGEPTVGVPAQKSILLAPDDAFDEGATFTWMVDACLSMLFSGIE